MFPIAMMNWMRPEPLEVTIERLARLGFQAIEVSGELAVDDAGWIRAELERHGLECWGAATIMTGGRDLVHEDKHVRAATVQYVKDTVTLASKLNGKIATITPAVGKLSTTASSRDERRWAIEGLRQVQAHAAELGIRAGIEALNRYETYLVNRCDQALELAEAVGEGFGVVLDVFHMNIEEASWVEAVRAAGGNLVDLHVADNNRLPPGRGSLSWKLLVEELKGIGYDGCLTVEFTPPGPLSGEEYDAWTAEALASLKEAAEGSATPR